MDDLLAALGPVRPSRAPYIALGLALATMLGAAMVVVAMRASAPAPCASAGTRVDSTWNPLRRIEVRAAFVATRIAYAPAVAERLIAQLDGWSAQWQAQSRESCKATLVDRVQPASTDALRQTCLDSLLADFRPVVDVARTPDAQVVAQASSLVSALPAPARCADVAGLSALPPLPAGESARANIAAVHAAIAEAEVNIRAERTASMRETVAALRDRANALGYLPLQANAQLLVGKLEVALGNYAVAKVALHEAARLATAARDQELLADTWTELAQALGNDPRTIDEAETFYAYAEAVIGQLAEPEARRVQLDFARCNANVPARMAERVIAACERVIAAAPQHRVANAARVRLGHFTRVIGKHDDGLAILRAAVAESVEVHGEAHPDTAVARNALGIALISGDDFATGINELRRALAIREEAFPGDSVQTAESLLGLGDALGASGNLEESIKLLDRGLAILARLHEDDSAQAANAHMLLGMTLIDAKRPVEALPHFVIAADIADRKLEHREPLAAMALRLAASAENEQGHIAEGVPYLERALRLLERGKPTPEDLGRTQYALGQFLYETGERTRARALLAAARASLVAAGPSGADVLAELDAFARTHR